MALVYGIKLSSKLKFTWELIYVDDESHYFACKESAFNEMKFSIVKIRRQKRAMLTLFVPRVLALRCWSRRGGKHSLIRDFYIDQNRQLTWLAVATTNPSQLANLIQFQGNVMIFFFFSLSSYFFYKFLGTNIWLVVFLSISFP